MGFKNSEQLLALLLGVAGAMLITQIIRRQCVLPLHVFFRCLFSGMFGGVSAAIAICFVSFVWMGVSVLAALVSIILFHCEDTKATNDTLNKLKNEITPAWAGFTISVISFFLLIPTAYQVVHGVDFYSTLIKFFVGVHLVAFGVYLLTSNRGIERVTSVFLGNQPEKCGELKHVQ